ncbi:MAG: hypothetical protein M3443_09985 [Actinomycetota bacterium]|nr:hypothetical protein [Actinomycetota bacterium]
MDGHPASLVEFTETRSSGAVGFARVHFVDVAAGAAAILITCDWNSEHTSAIEPAGRELLSSLTVTAPR